MSRLANQQPADLFPGLVPTAPDRARVAAAEAHLAETERVSVRARARAREAYEAYRDAPGPDMRLGLAWRAAAEECVEAWEAVRRAGIARRLAR